MASSSSLLSLLLLSSLALAKKAPTVQPVEPPPLSLNERVQQLQDATTRRPVIKMSSKGFRELVRTSPKNYSVVVMFTALKSHRGCAVCKPAGEEFALVANSYRWGVVVTWKWFLTLLSFLQVQPVLLQQALLRHD